MAVIGTVKISGAEHPIKDIFSDLFVFQVPAYQRPYSWTTEEAGELIDDLLNGLHEQDGEHDPYFLGSIVLAKAEDRPEAKIIDGQQRLTTLTLLLAAMAVREPALKVFIRQDGNPFKQTETTYRLRLRDRDADFFLTYVQEPGGLARLLELDASTLSDPRRNLQANARLFEKRLSSLDDATLHEFGKYLATRCFLVAVSTPDRDSAFRIFAVLNNRGLDLSPADIIKSEVIGAIPDAAQDAYTTRWEEAEAALGRDGFGDLFAHIRMRFAQVKQRGNLLKEFREYVLDPRADPCDFVDACSCRTPTCTRGFGQCRGRARTARRTSTVGSRGWTASTTLTGCPPPSPTCIATARTRNESPTSSHGWNG